MQVARGIFQIQDVGGSGYNQSSFPWQHACSVGYFICEHNCAVDPAITVHIAQYANSSFTLSFYRLPRIIAHFYYIHTAFIVPRYINRRLNEWLCSDQLNFKATVEFKMFHFLLGRQRIRIMFFF